MKKTYRPRAYRITLNIFYGFCAAFFVAILSNYFLETPLAILAGILTLIIYFYLVIFDCFITITITDQDLIYQKRRKVKKFKIKDCNFSARSTTSMAETSCSLYVTPPDSPVELIDCELISIKNFNLILDDLGVTGGRTTPIKLKTKQKE